MGADAEAEADAEGAAEGAAEPFWPPLFCPPLFWPPLSALVLFPGLGLCQPPEWPELDRQWAEADPVTRAKVPPEPSSASTAISTSCLVLNLRRWFMCCRVGMGSLISTATAGGMKPLGEVSTSGTA